MGLRQNSGMDRPAVIQTYGSVWIACVWYGSGVWICLSVQGMDRAVHFDSQPGVDISYIMIYFKFLGAKLINQKNWDGTTYAKCSAPSSQVAPVGYC